MLDTSVVLFESVIFADPLPLQAHKVDIETSSKAIVAKNNFRPNLSITFYPFLSFSLHYIRPLLRQV
jgi:hypothetical protein